MKETDKDYRTTKEGTRFKLEGPWENDRNQDSRQLFKDILKEAYMEEGATSFDSIIGHHLSYEAHYTGEDGFPYTVVQELPSADSLIFDHDVAKKLWGDGWKEELVLLALTPVEDRDEMLANRYYGRAKMTSEATA